MSMTADSSRAGMGALSIPAFTPFPTDCLPELTARYIRQAAKSIGCDESLIALPIFSAMASAVGNTRVIELKAGWQEPCIVWTAIVGESGTHKSPAIDRAMWSVNQRQKVEMDGFKDELAHYEAESQEYDQQFKRYKRSKNSECPIKPVAPTLRRLVCQDVTVEALAMLLAENPRGVLLVRDELSGWMSSFDAYKKQGSSGDVAQWLQVYNGNAMMVDRKTGDHKTILIPNASVCITGGIQPAELARCFGQRNMENGLAARLLMCMPPRTPCLWTDADMPDHEQAVMDEIFQSLWNLATNDNAPIACHFNEQGKQRYINYHDQLGHEITTLDGHLAAAWTKLRGYIARFALLIQLIRHAECGTLNPLSDVIIDEDSATAAIQLVRWFGNEARRIYQSINASNEARILKGILDYVQRKGGQAKLREIGRAVTGVENSLSTEKYCQKLQKAGHGEVFIKQPGMEGGQPSIQFRMLGNSHGAAGDGGTVNQPYSSVYDGDAA